MSVKMENGAVMPGDAPVSSQSTPVLITQAIPTSSHIVLTPNDDETPVYVQYVVPTDSKIISSPSDTSTDHSNLASIVDTIDSTVSAVSHSQRALSPVSNNFGAAPTVVLKYNSAKSRSNEDDEKKAIKKQKQAEAARLRYHRLDAEEKKALNLKRTQAQRRKRQREKEMQELDALLRESNDIVDDPEVTSQLKEKRLRARWAEAARSRYQRMTEEERRAHNVKRRMRQMTVKNENGEVLSDSGAGTDKVKEQNSKKALAARTRYHRMTNEEKKAYNQKRTEAFRRRRLEEEALLAMPIGRINGEALDRAQQIVVRNAKRAEAARLRYQRMTPEERRLYNQKRYTPKKRRETYLSKLRKTTNEAEPSPATSDGQINLDDMACQGHDSLTSLERDVMRRTQHAQQIIRERGLAAPSAINVTRVKPEFNSFPGIASVPGGPKRTVIKPKKPSSLANTIVVRPPPPPLPTQQHTAELA